VFLRERRVFVSALMLRPMAVSMAISGPQIRRRSNDVSPTRQAVGRIYPIPFPLSIFPTFIGALKIRYGTVLRGLEKPPECCRSTSACPLAHHYTLIHVRPLCATNQIMSWCPSVNAPYRTEPPAAAAGLQ